MCAADTATRETLRKAFLRKRSLEDQKLFLLLGRFARTVAVLCVGRRHNDRLIALIGAGARIRVSGFDIDICLLAQLGEISASRGFQALRINRFTNTVRDILQWRHTGGAMAGDFQDNESLPGPDYVSVFSWLEREGLIFQVFCQLATLEVAQRSAL